MSDGKTMTTSVAPLKKFMAAPAPEAITLDTFREGPVGSVLFGGPAGPPMFILLNLLVADDPVKEILELGGTLKVEDDRDVAGTPCQALLIDQEEGPDFRLLVDPETKLLKGIDLVVDPEALVEEGAPGAEDRDQPVRLVRRARSRPRTARRRTRSPTSPPRSSPRSSRSPRGADEGKTPSRRWSASPPPTSP